MSGSQVAPPGSKDLWINVALPIPLRRALTYRLPRRVWQAEPAQDPKALRGRRIICPMRGKRTVGVVLEVFEAPPKLARAGTKAPAFLEALELLPGASLPEELLTFLERLAAYYVAPVGEVFALALPPQDRATERATQDLMLFPPVSKGVADPQAVFASLTEAGRAFDFGAKVSGRKAPSTATLRLVELLRAKGEVQVVELQAEVLAARAIVTRLALQGLLITEKKARPRDAYFDDVVEKNTAPLLTQEQTAAVQELTASLDKAEQQAFLLRGVTGSGKTEVYFAAIAHASSLGKGSLVLVPEIALTPQLVSRYRARFGDDVAVLHSGLSAADRFHMWMQLHQGKLRVAIGARSALFAPVLDLGLILVDEEHDPSFKQEEGIRYHARDMAILRGHRAGATVVLGSATPSLETEHLVESGKARLLLLKERAQKQALPTIEIVDMRKYRSGFAGGERRITVPLVRAMEKTLAQGEQIILFLNRRGFAPSALCASCGTLMECPHCAVSLTFHKRKAKPDPTAAVVTQDAQAGDAAAAPASLPSGVLRCHYCEYFRVMQNHCPSCEAAAIVLEGLGTEKLEEELKALFPQARIARLDRDVASANKSERILAQMRARELDILVGTQMVAKGHDLPGVTLVGVINADAALSIPDFRASERAFQLLVQVAGRAGRGDRAGRVLIQTFGPTHPVITHAQRHDTEGFRAVEMKNRKELGYPPFSRLVFLRIDALSEEKAKAYAMTLAQALRGTVDVLGPAVAPIARLRNRFRFRVVLRSNDRAKLREILLQAARFLEAVPSGIRVTIDVDPSQTM
jgi:primosomal protein N' (replication factor Y) (superfamily II helicase)